MNDLTFNHHFLWHIAPVRTTLKKALQLSRNSKYKGNLYILANQNQSEVSIL